MSDLERVRYRVHRAMDEWERGHPTGSAWPVFEALWARVCGEERYQPGRRDRHQVWRAWVGGGPALTKESMVATLRHRADQPLTTVHPNVAAERQRDQGARLKWMRDLADDIERREVTPGRYGLFGDILATVAKRREPGEEG